MRSLDQFSDVDKEYMILGFSLIANLLSITRPSYKMHLKEALNALNEILSKNFSRAIDNTKKIESIVKEKWYEKYKEKKITLTRIKEIYLREISDEQILDTIYRYQRKQIEKTYEEVSPERIKDLILVLMAIKEHKIPVKRRNKLGCLIDVKDFSIVTLKSDKKKLVYAGKKLGIFIHIPKKFVKDSGDLIFIPNSAINKKTINLLKGILKSKMKGKTQSLEVFASSLFLRNERLFKEVDWQILEEEVANELKRLGFHVERNKRLYGVAGMPEIDVFASKVGKYGTSKMMRLKIAVECKFKKADTTDLDTFNSKLERLAGKHKPHIALIIAKDFTKDARDVADRVGILLGEIGYVKNRLELRERIREIFKTLRNAFMSSEIEDKRLM